MKKRAGPKRISIRRNTKPQGLTAFVTTSKNARWQRLYESMGIGWW